MYDWGSYVLQAVANVNQESIPQRVFTKRMSSTLATTSIKGYILAGDETGYAVIDLLANGYVEEQLGLSETFGTSFATPRVFSEIVNFYDEFVAPNRDG